MIYLTSVITSLTKESLHFKRCFNFILIRKHSVERTRENLIYFKWRVTGWYSKLNFQYIYKIPAFRFFPVWTDHIATSNLPRSWTWLNVSQQGYLCKTIIPSGFAFNLFTDNKWPLLLGQFLTTTNHHECNILQKYCFLSARLQIWLPEYLWTSRKQGRRLDNQVRNTHWKSTGVIKM